LVVVQEFLLQGLQQMVVLEQTSQEEETLAVAEAVAEVQEVLDIWHRATLETMAMAELLFLAITEVLEEAAEMAVQAVKAAVAAVQAAAVAAAVQAVALDHLVVVELVAQAALE
jgi:hypothetical protein